MHHVIKSGTKNISIGLFLLVLMASTLLGCISAEDQRRRAQEQQQFQTNLRSIKLGMSVSEAESLLGGPPFLVEPVLPESLKCFEKRGGDVHVHATSSCDAGIERCRQGVGYA